MTPKRTSSPYGMALVVTASMLYASYGVWITLIGDSFDSFSQAVIRGLIVACILLLIGSVTKQNLTVRWRKDKKWLLVLLAANAIIQAPMFYAVQKIGVGLGLAIGYVSVVLATYVLGKIIYNEPLGQYKALAILLGMTGVVFVFGNGGSSSNIWAIGAAIVSGIGTAVDIVALQKLRYPAIQAAALSWLAVAISNAPLAVLFGIVVPSMTNGRYWLLLIIFAAVSLVASWIHTSGVKIVETGVVGILGLLEIVFAIAVGLVFFNENLRPLQVLGAICIFTACALPYLSSKKRIING